MQCWWIFDFETDYINILEELNDQIHETLATVIPNMLRLARENLIKRARLFLQMKGGHFEHLL
jgi:hypothetical protein